MHITALTLKKILPNLNHPALSRITDGCSFDIVPGSGDYFSTETQYAIKDQYDLITLDAADCVENYA
jgi:hypothetical protein